MKKLLAMAAILLAAACETIPQVHFPAMQASVIRHVREDLRELVIHANNVLPNHTYEVGLWTNDSPTFIGTATSGATGVIDVGVLYNCGNEAPPAPGLLHAGLYEPGGQGVALVVAVVEGEYRCL